MKIKDIVVPSIATFLVLSLTACSGGGGGGSSAPPAPGIAVSATTLSTTEDATEASFTVTLNTQPTSDVEVDFQSQDTSEGLIKTDSIYDYWGTYAYLTFTPDNWNVPQTIHVQGQADSVADGNQTYSVASSWVWSMDENYFDVAMPSVSVTNEDTDVKGITVSTTSLSTTENGYSRSFSVSLNLTPDGTVEIPLTISDATEGSFSSSEIITEMTLTFTSKYSQTVYIYDVDDIVADGNQTYDITVGPSVSTADLGYNGLIGDTISVTNADNDTAGFTLSKSEVSTTEWGQNADFTVVLNTQPTADVVIPVTSPDVTEGLVSSFSATPAASLDLTFTSANWNTPQTVTVNGQDDAELDGDTSYNITVGAPTGAAEYALLTTQTVAVANIDDDTARVNVQGADLQTTEAGGTDTFVVSLAKAPVGDVVINITSNDTTEGLVKGGSSLTPIDAITLTFNAINWQTAQTVTVVGKDDLEVDGNQSFTVGVAIDTGLTADADYDSIAAQSVSVTNADNDVAGMSVTTGTIYINESGTADTFTVKLNTIPTGDVTVPVTVEDASEMLIESGVSGQVATLNLTFTPADWATPQLVTVRAVNDYVDENYEYFDVTIGAATSSDTNYNGLAAITRSVSITDNDTRGFVVTPSTGLTTSETASTTSFTVALATEPVGTAFVNVSSGNTAEGLLTGGNSPTTQVSAVTLEFTAADWQTGQTVTVHGQDDAVLDGPITYNVTVDDISGYSATAKTATVTNSDNEVGISQNFTLTIAELPYSGQVSPIATSTYSMSLSAGWKYTVTADTVTDDISLTVKDGTSSTTLCTSAKTGVKTTESCAFTTPADGSVNIVIDGTGTENGAGFTLSLSEPVYPATFEIYSNAYPEILLYDADILTNPNEYSLDSDIVFPGFGWITYDLVAGQTYYLKVRQWSSSTGPYQVQVTGDAASLTKDGTATNDTLEEPENNAVAGAVTLTLDTPLERYQSDSDVDWYKYTVPMP